MNLLSLLKSNPDTRERKNKNKAIAMVLKSRYGGLENMEGKTVTNIVLDVISMDREWRKILEVNEDLRGDDYGEGTRLAQEKMIELGYESGANLKLKV